MGKRAPESSMGEQGRESRKRQKRSQVDRNLGSAEDIQSSVQLKRLLVFHQDIAPTYRQAVKVFRSFLKLIQRNTGDHEGRASERKASLLEYLESKLPQNESRAADDLYHLDILQAWNFVSKTSSDPLLSAIPEVLALLLETISGLIEFRDVGLRLCKVLLQPTALKLLSGATSVNKKSEHILVPCLDLLSQLVSYDGGLLAKRVYSQREYTYKALGRNLGLRRVEAVEEADQRKPKSSVRNAALQYLFANLRFLDPLAKIDLLGHREIISAVFREIREDPPKTILDILSVFKVHVIQDESLHARSRGRFLSEWTLSHVATLYGYETKLDVDVKETSSVELRAHEFLLLVCTTPGLGVLYHETGWHLPLGDEDKDPEGEVDSLEGDLLNWVDKEGIRQIGEGVPGIRNYRLAAFIRQLRPHASTLQSDLLLTIFEAAPELVADYFIKNRAFTYDPKLTATWVGYSAFLFSAIQLPIPPLFGRHDGRCPRMRDVVAVFRKIPDEYLMQREAIARLLAIYYDVIPQVALDEKFDISISLSRALERVQAGVEDNEDFGIRQLELEHLLEIAKCSPNMRWWNKPEKLHFSPFTTLLKLHVDLPEGSLKKLIKEVLETVNDEVQIFQTDTRVTALDAVTTSFTIFDDDETPAAAWAFFDNCVGRLVRKPVHYYDELATLKSNAGIDRKEDALHSLSVVLLTVVEQWRFYYRSSVASITDKNCVARWIIRLLGYCRFVGEDGKILEKLQIELCKSGYSPEICSLFRQDLRQMTSDNIPTSADSEGRKANTTTTKSSDFSTFNVDSSHVADDEGPPQVDLHAALIKWVRKDMADAVDDGDIRNLILCLCSDEVGVRHQAMSAISRAIAKLEGSGYVERDMMALLLQETIHTAKPIIEIRPMPTFLGTFAAHSVAVEANPQHPLYTKLNAFLHRGPTWDHHKVPLINKILLQSPSEDDAFFKEVQWLLDVLIDGLGVTEDLDVYRRNNVFEQVLTLFTLPQCPTAIGRGVIKLIHRATRVEGGSTTLITRVGILSWLEMQMALEDESDITWKRLARRIYDTCDQRRVTEWGGATLEKANGSFAQHIAAE
ncbi:MAG: hypothetical protein M1833_005461 [Piccolia ochrophora]|nr:MAG: hypothetical protein M1833_005461 [Piccolia ochrophora]